MASNPKIAFIGAGSTVFMRTLIGDVLQVESLSGAHIALMDIDSERLNQSVAVAQSMIQAFNVPATVTAHLDQKEALDQADFVITAFQVGGYDPCTITDFEIPKQFGLRQTIADTIGIGGIMRALRTVPHLWSVCEDMMAVCPDATMLQYVNPMAMNIWAINQKYPSIKVVGLCHSIQHTATALCTDLGIDEDKLKYKVAGINHIAFFLELEELLDDGSYLSLYPALHEGYVKGLLPTDASMENPRCKNLVRYEMLKRTGFFVTESSEHFAEYVPWFIKSGRDDLIEKFQIPLDEYQTRCIGAIERWKDEQQELEENMVFTPAPSVEYATRIMDSVWTGIPSVIYGNVENKGLIENLPRNCVVEVPCLVDRNGIQPTQVGVVPSHLVAIMQSNVSVQGLIVDALINERRDNIYHAAMMDPHTGAELDLDQIWQLVDQLIEAHGQWLPDWINDKRKIEAA